MRLFVALPVPQEVRRALQDATGRLRGQQPELRWTEPAGWHLTLAFLGTVGDEELDEVATVLRRSLAGAHLPHRLYIGEPGRFGREVLYVSVVDEPAGALERLAGRVRDALTAGGWPVDARPLRPHLTLARARRGATIGAGLVGSLLGPTGDGLTWRPSTVELWSSHLGGGPARYEVEASVAVDGSG